jgi:hypothetical protein
VKNAALKKLFADPQFNVMDGLDTYIDDYGKPDPLPERMLRQMVQARFLGLFATKKKHSRGERRGPDEDADLRLQPDDAAGPARAPLRQALARRRARALTARDVHTLLCRREAGASSAPRARGDELLVACTQESRLFSS